MVGRTGQVGPRLWLLPKSFQDTWLVTKEDHHTDALTVFEGTNINIASTGRLHLGAALDTPMYTNQFVAEKVDQFSSEVRLLSAIATTQPHAAFAAFDHPWVFESFFSRTLPNLSIHLQPLENIIRSDFIPSLTGNPPPNDADRNIAS